MIRWKIACNGFGSEMIALVMLLLFASIYTYEELDKKEMCNASCMLISMLPEGMKFQ